MAPAAGALPAVTFTDPAKSEPEIVADAPDPAPEPAVTVAVVSLWKCSAWKSEYPLPFAPSAEMHAAPQLCSDPLFVAWLAPNRN